MNHINDLDPNGQPVTRRLNLARNADRDASELIGLSRGVLADGVLAQSEAEYLLSWLEERPECLSVWPFSVLFMRLQEMLSDGLLDSAEEAELIGLLLDFTGGGTSNGIVGSASRQASKLPLCDPLPEVLFGESNFVLTGRFVSGTRKECEGEILKRGGMTQSNPTKKTRFLVIGELGSDDWAQSTYGRKIQKGIELRADGNPIHIIDEEHWSKSL